MADRAYAEMRDRIVTLRIPPGSPIDEDALGKEFEMGRTPVREAIKRLSLENLVTVFPRRGTFASEINITDLAHIADVRVPARAPRRLPGRRAHRPAQREQLEALLDELDRSDATADARDLVRLDTRVHRFVYQCADNPYLEETLGRYLNLSLRIWHLVIDRLPNLSARVQEHRELLTAIRDGEAERARTIAGDHVITFEQRDPLGPLSRLGEMTTVCSSVNCCMTCDAADAAHAAVGAGAPAEREVALPVVGGLVDVDPARAHALGELQPAGEVGGEDGDEQAVGRGVGQLDRLLERVDRDERGDRAERLLGGDAASAGTSARIVACQ